MTSTVAQVSQFLTAVTGVGLLGFSGFGAHKLRQIISSLDSAWHLADGISLRVSFIERRLMCLEFSPWEVQRQIANAISEWDMNQDAQYGGRQTFQFLGRYSRNFLQRTSRMPSALQLSIIANMAITESGEDAAGPKIVQLRQQLHQYWASQFHGQGDGFNPAASVSTHGDQLSQEQLVDFYGFQ